MSEIQQRADELQKKVMALWRRYRELTTAVLALQADIEDLRRDKDEIGKQIYELYLSNDRCLDCEKINRSDRSYRSDGSDGTD